MKQGVLTQAMGVRSCYSRPWLGRRGLEKTLLLIFGVGYLVGVYRWSFNNQQIFAIPTADDKPTSGVQESFWAAYAGLAEEAVVEIPYSPPYSEGVSGESFRVSGKTLHRLGIPPRDYVTLNNVTARDFVFVTAASGGFVSTLTSTVARLQEHVPDYKIYVYDLGMSNTQVEMVKTWCNVIYKKFDFSDLPEHVNKLRTYAWKPLIILEVLKTEPGVFWVDTSVRFSKTDLSPLLEKVVETQGGILTSTTGHSTFAATHKDMYHYLVPRDMDALKREEQRESTALLFRTFPIMEHVLPWLAFCALEKHCIAPTDRLSCIFKGDHFHEYANCHRFDQSAINILMMNLYNMSSWAFYRNSGVLQVQRYRDNSQPKVCLPNKQ